MLASSLLAMLVLLCKSTRCQRTRIPDATRPRTTSISSPISNSLSASCLLCPPEHVLSMSLPSRSTVCGTPSRPPILTGPNTSQRTGVSRKATLGPPHGLWLYTPGSSSCRSPLRTFPFGSSSYVRIADIGSSVFLHLSHSKELQARLESSSEYASKDITVYSCHPGQI